MIVGRSTPVCVALDLRADPSAVVHRHETGVDARRHRFQVSQLHPQFPRLQCAGRSVQERLRRTARDFGNCLYDTDFHCPSPGGGGVGVSRIAEHLHLSGAFVTIEVSKLVKAELVRKRTNKTDRRRVLLTVTPKGRKLLDGLVTVQAPINDALFDCLSAAEFEQLSSMMARLVPCGDQAISLMTFMTKKPADADLAGSSGSGGSASVRAQGGAEKPKPLVSIILGNHCALPHKPAGAAARLRLTALHEQLSIKAITFGGRSW